MARIVVASYVVRLPLGGYQSWMLHWLVGFQRLGHDVWFVEKSGWSNSCIDPETWVRSDNFGPGLASWHALLSRFGLGNRWCYVDHEGQYHGTSRADIESVFRSADLFVDKLRGCEWPEESRWAGHRTFVDGEPGMTQIVMMQEEGKRAAAVPYDSYYSVGLNIGTPASPVPTANRTWRGVFDPIVADLFEVNPPPAGAPFTTVMSWQAHKDFEFQGVSYGSKYLEFPKIHHLPSHTAAPLEIAVSGRAPLDDMRSAGWRVRDSVPATRTYDAWLAYIASSLGEISVCKNYFVALNTGFFSDRSAAYLASGRPVIMQETGFSAHLPVGEGLFAFRTVEEAAAAIDAVQSDYPRHARAAREIAYEYLDTRKVLPAFLSGVGL